MPGVPGESNVREKVVKGGVGGGWCQVESGGVRSVGAK